MIQPASAPHRASPDTAGEQATPWGRLAAGRGACRDGWIFRFSGGPTRTTLFFFRYSSGIFARVSVKTTLPFLSVYL